MVESWVIVRLRETKGYIEVSIVREEIISGSNSSSSDRNSERIVPQETLRCLHPK